MLLSATIVRLQISPRPVALPIHQYVELAFRARIAAFVSAGNNRRYLQLTKDRLLLTKDNSASPFTGRPRQVSICQSRADMI